MVKSEDIENEVEENPVDKALLPDADVEASTEESNKPDSIISDPEKDAPIKSAKDKPKTSKDEEENIEGKIDELELKLIDKYAQMSEQAIAFKSGQSMSDVIGGVSGAGVGFSLKRQMNKSSKTQSQNVANKVKLEIDSLFPSLMDILDKNSKAYKISEKADKILNGIYTDAIGVEDARSKLSKLFVTEVVPEFSALSKLDPASQQAAKEYFLLNSAEQIAKSPNAHHSPFSDVLKAVDIKDKTFAPRYNSLATYASVKPFLRDSKTEQMANDKIKKAREIVDKFEEGLKASDKKPSTYAGDYIKTHKKEAKQYKKVFDDAISELNKIFDKKVSEPEKLPDAARNHFIKRSLHIKQTPYGGMTKVVDALAGENAYELLQSKDARVNFFADRALHFGDELERTISKSVGAAKMLPIKGIALVGAGALGGVAAGRMIYNALNVTQGNKLQKAEEEISKMNEELAAYGRDGVDLEAATHKKGFSERLVEEKTKGHSATAVSPA